MLTFLAPIVANFALDFGPPEYFAVYLLTFCSFVGMGRQSPFKVISAMMLGFAFACVGTDEVTGGLRLTFGTETLLTGFHFLIAVIGLFGIGEILVTIEKGLHFEGRSAKINPFVVWQTWKKLPQFWVTILRGTAVGIWLGVTPGGATPASFMSYGLAKRFSQERRTSSAPASWKAWWRRRPRRMPPAPARCCRCSRSAFPARRPRRCCSAAC